MRRAEGRAGGQQEGGDERGYKTTTLDTRIQMRDCVTTGGNLKICSTRTLKDHGRRESRCDCEDRRERERGREGESERAESKRIMGKT